MKAPAHGHRVCEKTCSPTGRKNRELALRARDRSCKSFHAIQSFLVGALACESAGPSRPACGRQAQCKQDRRTPKEFDARFASMDVQKERFGIFGEPRRG